MPLDALKIQLLKGYPLKEDDAPSWQESPGVSSYVLHYSNEEEEQRAWIHVPTSYDDKNNTDEHKIGSNRYPLLMVLHGAGKGSSYWNLEEQVKSFAAIANQYNILILSPEAKRSTWDFIGTSGSHDTKFLQFALNATRRQWRVDDNRIAIKGISDGGSMALCLVTYNRSIFQASLAVSAGFCKLESRQRQDKNIEKDSSDSPRLPSLFLQHGEDDTMFPLDRVGRRNEEKLRIAGFPVKFRVALGQGHVPEDWRTSFVEEWLSLTPKSSDTQLG